MLKPFFCFFGGKWRAAPKYPTPQYHQICEPFAGAAGYACRYASHAVVLYDVDPVIYRLWKFLIKVGPSEIIRLPTDIEHIDDVKSCEEAKWLVGFWLNKGTARPCTKPGAWMRSGVRRNSFWSPHIRDRIASQVDKIKHWKVFNRSFEACTDKERTWFIDPPYQVAGRSYKFNSVRYDVLSEWCKSRKGQIIVCENVGADWLPFQELNHIKAAPGKHRKGTSREALWYKINTPQSNNNRIRHDR